MSTILRFGMILFVLTIFTPLWGQVSEPVHVEAGPVPVPSISPTITPLPTISTPTLNTGPAVRAPEPVRAAPVQAAPAASGPGNPPSAEQDEYPECKVAEEKCAQVCDFPPDPARPYTRCLKLNCHLEAEGCIEKLAEELRKKYEQ